MSKSLNSLTFYKSIPLRSICPIGDFWVVHYQYLERCGVWRTLGIETFYKFELADKVVTAFLRSHNRFHRCSVFQFSSPAIVAGYEVTVNH